MAVSNEQAYREMLSLLHNESKITDELAPIDGDTDDMADGRATADSLCSSALLLLADPDQVCNLQILNSNMIITWSNLTTIIFPILILCFA